MSTSKAHHLVLLWTIGLLAVAAGACGPNPEKAGDECDPNSGCPDALVCAPEGDKNLCFNDLGGACAAGGVDYCLGDSTCTDQKVCELPLGASCDSAAAKDYCAGEGQCLDGSCLLPVGAGCDPAGKTDYCVGDNVCAETLDGKGKCGIAEGGECDPKDPQCAGSLACAELKAGGYACHPPVLITGMVFDSKTAAGIEGGHVLALDDQATAITDVAVSDASGNYSLDLPLQREADGSPIKDVVFTLRAGASGYQSFPGGLRTALPLKTSEAVSGKLAWTIDTALTDIALIALPAEQQGLPSISGTVTAEQGQGGVLVVAEDGSGPGLSAITDRAGVYTIFNVPDGAFTVHGYAAGLQLTPAMATMAGKELTGIDLAPSADALGTISGNVTIVNAPGGAMTSVVLVVASTFDDTFVRGDVPRGLRTPLSGPPNVTSSFMIKDVPAGDYVVLAAFENDGLVRDPDPNISGTQIVTVKMAAPGTAVAVGSSFKITEALAVSGPGANDPEPVTDPPTLTWADDSSEDFYTVVVYNAYGDRVWCLSDQVADCDGPNIPGVSGVDDVSVPYGGPMEPGMYYQFRATSWRSPGGNPGPISTTEDLRGVFYVTAKK